MGALTRITLNAFGHIAKEATNAAIGAGAIASITDIGAGVRARIAGRFGRPRNHDLERSIRITITI